MKQSKNVLCWSVLVAIIAGFMAGCGGGGFKSKTYSEKEIAAYLKNLTPKEALNDVTGAPPMTEIPEQTMTDTPLTNVNLPAAPTGPVGTTPDSLDTAGSKVISEPPPEAVEFVASNSAQLMQKSPEIAKFVRGITVDIAAGSAGSALQVSVHAIVVLGGGDQAPLLLSALNAPLTYIAQGTVPPINVTLQHDESNPELVQPLDNVILAAVCTDAACADVQVRMQFKDTEMFQQAVFRLGLQDGKYVMLENNLTDTPAFKTYEVARQELRDIESQAAAMTTSETAPAEASSDNTVAAPVADVAAAATEQAADLSLGNVNAPASTSVDAALTNSNAAVALPAAPPSADAAAAAASQGAVGAPVGPRVAATGDIAGLMAKIHADEAAAAAAAKATPVAAAAATPPRVAATGDVAGLMAKIHADEAAAAAAKVTAPAATAAPTTAADIANKLRLERLARQRKSNAQ